MYFFVLDFKVWILQVWKVVTKIICLMSAKTCQNALKSVVTNATFRCASTLKSMEDVNKLDGVSPVDNRPSTN